MMKSNNIYFYVNYKLSGASSGSAPAKQAWIPIKDAFPPISAQLSLQDKVYLPLKGRFILILLLFVSIYSVAQDSKVICKNKNLFVPTGYIKDRNLNDIFNKCKNLQVVSENNIFLFTGFEKYGYTLLIDTMTQKPRILNYFYGYFDLVNNTNVPLTILKLGYSVDIMHIIPLQKNRTQLLPGESIKVKYILVNGLSKISDQSIKKLIYNEENDEKNINKNLLFNQLIVKQIINKSNSYYSMSNILNIGAQYQNGEFIDKNRFLIVFRIPVKYFQNIEYGHPY